jgi:hypothetical protein
MSGMNVTGTHHGVIRIERGEGIVHGKKAGEDVIENPF